MTKVLVTRPEPDASASAKLIEAAGFEAMVDPLFSLATSSAPPPLESYSALIATSRNALRALQGHAFDKINLKTTFFAVGTETAQAAKAAGFTDIRTADGDVRSLDALIAGRLDPEKDRLLYLAGKKRRPELEKNLAVQGYSLDVWESYDMTASAGLAPQTLSALQQGGIDAVMLYSERAAARFIELNQISNKDALKIPLYVCLSDQVAKPLRGFVHHIRVAERPDTAAMITALKRHFLKSRA